MNDGKVQRERGMRRGARSSHGLARPRPARGFMMIDILMGLTLLGVLLGAMALAGSESRHGSRELGDQRAAARIAQAVLVDLRLGHPAPADREGAHVDLTRLETSADPRGQAWFEVRVRRGKQTAKLIGLAPAGSALVKSPTPAPPSSVSPGEARSEGGGS